MSLASNLVTLAAIVTAGALFAVIRAKTSSGGRDDAARFKSKTLLTANELDLLLRLEAAAPEVRFHAQVSMGALLDPAVPRKDAKAFYRLRGMFSQKIVDFVAQDRRSGEVLAVIELDDRTHDREKDAKRDSMLACAGYRIIRWSSKAKPDAAAIRSSLLPVPVQASVKATRPATSSAQT